MSLPQVPLLPLFPRLSSAFWALSAVFPAVLWAQLPYVETFDAETSAKVLPIQTDNMEIRYVDYSSFSVGTTEHSLPEAPNTPEGSAATRGVLMRCLYTDSGVARIANLLLASAPAPNGSPITFGGNYRLTYDMYLSLSPDTTPSSAGTTEQGVWGVGLTDQVFDFPVGRYHRDALLPEDPSELGLIGTYGWIASDGGYSTEDVALRINEPGGLKTIHNFGNTSPLFTTAFPDATPLAATPCNQWVHVEITCLDGEVSVKYNGVEFFREFSAQLEGYAAVGYEDAFVTSDSFAPDYQFCIIDNVRVEEANTPILGAELGAGFTTVTSADGSSTAEIILSNLSPNPITVTAAEFGGDTTEFSLATALPLTIPAHNSAVLNVLFKPGEDAANGLRATSLTLTLDSPNLPTYLFAPLQAKRSVAPRFQAHYKLDETSGTTLADSSGNNVNAILQVRDPVVYGAEGLASGTSLGLTPANSSTSGNYFTSNIVHSPTFSFSAWIKPNGSGNRSLFNRDPNFSGTDSIYGLVLNNSGQLDFRVRSTSLVVSEEGAIENDEVYHVVLTHLDTDGFGNETADRTRLYINGELVAEVEAFDTLGFDDYPYDASSVVQALHIGSKTAAGFGYSGLLDDIQIYGIELTPEQVRGLYQNPGKNIDELANEPPLPIPAPVVTRASFDAEARQFQLEWTAQAGASYKVKVSTNLIEWTDMTSDPITATGDTASVTDGPLPDSTAAKFYRVEPVAP